MDSGQGKYTPEGSRRVVGMAMPVHNVNRTRNRNIRASFNVLLT